MLRHSALLLALALPARAANTPPAAAINEHLMGRWDITIAGPQGKLPSWLEVQIPGAHSGGDSYAGRFVGVVGSARPIERVILNGDSLRFSIPTDWEGPMAKFFRGAPDARIVLVAIALLYAPLFEELVFRGMMLRGMRASWGPTAAGIVVTILFFALHLTETYGYWPAMLAILTFSVVALFARLRTGSLLPAIAAHLGYNIVVMFAFKPNP